MRKTYFSPFPLMCNMLFEVNCSCEWTQKEVCFSVRVTELRSLWLLDPLTLSIRYVILQREVWTVGHTFTMSYQSFSHDFKTVDHHHPRLAHSQAVHVPICLCQLGTDATGEEHNSVSGNQNKCIIIAFDLPESDSHDSCCGQERTCCLW